MSSQSIQYKLEDLTRQMGEAAAAEDFEQAALLRNQIEALTGPVVRKRRRGRWGSGPTFRWRRRPGVGRVRRSRTR